MREMLNAIVFGWYPYICVTVFLFGSLVRFDREQYTWRTGSSQLLRRRQLTWGSNLFHVGILMIAGGHFVGLLTPIWIFDMLGVSHSFKQMLAIVAGGIAGLMCLVGMRCSLTGVCSIRVSAPTRPSAIPRSCFFCSLSFCWACPPSSSRSVILMATRWSSSCPGRRAL